MNNLQAGFARVDVTPPLGIAINGYFVPRIADGVRDPLEINCLALACAETKVVLLSMDNTGISNEVLADIFTSVCQATGLPKEAIFIHSTHTHTAGALLPNFDGPIEQEYKKTTCRKMADAAKLALDDLQPAQMGWRAFPMPPMAYSRRYRMKDGSVRTNPGIGNPDILEMLGKADDQLRILRFKREQDDLVLLHFGMHPDTVGGCQFSADWPGFARRTLEQAIPGVKAVFFNGAEGEIGCQNTSPVSGDMNGLSLDFDDVWRGYEATRHIGRVIAGAALQCFDTVLFTDVDKLTYGRRQIKVPANVPTPEELPLARKYADLHNDGHDDQIPYTGMQLTTVVAEALRMVRLAEGPEYFDMFLSGIGIGPVALMGVPGEPFAGVSFGVQDAEGWDNVLVTCNTNGKEGYFPMQDAYDEGGYESRSSNFKAGVAELLIAEGTALLESIR